MTKHPLLPRHRSAWQLTHTREIEGGPVEKFERLSNATATGSSTAIVGTVEQQLEIRPLLIDDLIQQVPPAGAGWASMAECKGMGGAVAVVDDAGILGIGTDVFGVECAIKAADWARDVCHGLIIEDSVTPAIVGHGSGHDEST